MRELEYPFFSQMLLKRKRALRKALLNNQDTKKDNISLNIAILGGSTTKDIADIIELFLLNEGFHIHLYESEYGKYWEDVVFENKKLDAFKPDIIYICTSIYNIIEFPAVSDSEAEVSRKLENNYSHFKEIWDAISAKYKCVVIQNNFEYPRYRLLGNMDSYDYRGKTNFILKLNEKIARYASENSSFYICDTNYLSAQYGLSAWSDPYYWYMYKYSMAVPAIPELSYNVYRIIKAVYGKNKKVIVTDLDNTLWGGVLAEDGLEEIQIGRDSSVGQMYSDIQAYLREQKELGVILAINSKNDERNVVAGLQKEESVLSEKDFSAIKANWNPKSQNMREIALDLKLGSDSLVFLDDNPGEREEVRLFNSRIGIPELSKPEYYIQEIDRAGYFECIGISNEDLVRGRMYEEAELREQNRHSYSNYDDFLQSLEMKAEIGKFSSQYYSRIAQLTNKSNQFNLTTKRCSKADIEEIAQKKNYVTLYGKLSDKFGDNGLVSVIFGHIDADKITFHIDEWLMSCRVLKRDLEKAMMDILYRRCLNRGVKTILGYYYRTDKNEMVKEHYREMGFLLFEDKGDSTVWKFDVATDYVNKNTHILVEEEKDSE